MLDGREIGGHVVEAAVALADERRVGHPFAVAIHEEGIFLGRHRAITEHADRAFALSRNATSEQIRHDVAKPRIIEALAESVIELHAEPSVDRVELHLRQPDHLLPDGEVVRVAGLELHQFLLRQFEPRRISVTLRIDQLVEAFHLADGIALERRAIEEFLPADEQLAELRAPVADVIVRDDVMTEQTQHALERITDAGGADVADVHRLRDVRRAEVDDDGAWLGGLGVEEVFPTEGGLQRLRDGVRLDAKVEEASACNFNLLAPLADIEFGDDIGGELTRVHLPRLGDGHQRVRLVITELRIGAGTDEQRSGIGVGKDGGDGDAELVFEQRVKHEE